MLGQLFNEFPSLNRLQKKTVNNNTYFVSTAHRSPGKINKNLDDFPSCMKLYLLISHGDSSFSALVNSDSNPSIFRTSFFPLSLPYPLSLRKNQNSLVKFKGLVPKKISCRPILFCLDKNLEAHQYTNVRQPEAQHRGGCNGE